MRQLTNSEAVALLAHGYDRYLTGGATPVDAALFPEGTAANTSAAFDEAPPDLVTAEDWPALFAGRFAGLATPAALSDLVRVARHRDGSTLSIVQGLAADGWLNALLDERPAGSLLEACGWPGPVGNMFPELLPPPIPEGNESTYVQVLREQEAEQVAAEVSASTGPAVGTSDQTSGANDPPTLAPAASSGLAGSGGGTANSGDGSGELTADNATVITALALDHPAAAVWPAVPAGPAVSLVERRPPAADRLSRCVDLGGIELSAHSASLLSGQLVACVRRLVLPTEGFAWEDVNDGFGCRVGSYLSVLDLGLYACMLALPVVHLEGGRDVRVFASLELVAAVGADAGGWSVTVFDPSVEPVQGRPVSTLEPELLDAQAVAAEEVRAILTRAGVVC